MKLIAVLIFYGLAISGIIFNNIPLSLMAIGIALSPELQGRY